MDGYMARLEERIYIYRFFSHLFLVLPDEAFVERMLAYPADGSEGGALIAAWARACEGRPSQEVLTEVSVDRTRLFRGLIETGPVPPYESLFVGGSKDNAVALLEVVEHYRKIGFEQTGGVHDSPEYLGVEMAFMDQALSKELEGLRSDDESVSESYRATGEAFITEHLGWVSHYADEMYSCAQTGLYRGAALLLRSFIEEECAQWC